MVTRNINGAVNGSLGKVVAMGDEKISVELLDEKDIIVVVQEGPKLRAVGHRLFEGLLKQQQPQLAPPRVSPSSPSPPCRSSSAPPPMSGLSGVANISLAPCLLNFHILCPKLN